MYDFLFDYQKNIVIFKDRAHKSNVTTRLCFSYRKKTFSQFSIRSTRSIPGQITVLAPHDAAFAYLPVSIDDLKQRLVRSPKEMRRFVLYHLLPGYVTSRDFKADTWIATCLFEKSVYLNTQKVFKIGNYYYFFGNLE